MAPAGAASAKRGQVAGRRTYSHDGFAGDRFAQMMPAFGPRSMTQDSAARVAGSGGREAVAMYPSRERLQV